MKKIIKRSIVLVLAIPWAVILTAIIILTWIPWGEKYIEWYVDVTTENNLIKDL
jgi:hypothetical protein